MKTLAIDTSAIASSVAVCEEGKILSELFLNTKLTHSQTLLPMVDAALSCAALSLDDIDRYVITSGPGSFTGLRIGIAAIKGMAFKADKPCIPVSSLMALGMNLAGFVGTICAVMDARCNQFYNALFYADGSGTLKRLTPDRAIPAAELYAELDRIDSPIYVVGDGAILCCNNYNGNAKLILAPEQLRYARASGAAAAANPDDAIPCDALVPEYLRLPQAERERLAREQAQKENSSC